MFNYEAYKRLLDKVTSDRKYAVDPDDVELAEMTLTVLSAALKSFTEYVTSVVNTDNDIRMARARYTGQELARAIEEADRQRHNCHEAAIANVGMVNRLAEKLKLPPVFTGDNKNRLDVAEFCMEITQTLFQNRSL